MTAGTRSEAKRTAPPPSPSPSWTWSPSAPAAPPPTPCAPASTSPASPSPAATTATGSPNTTPCPASPRSSPAVILAHLAAHTTRIRLGSGGVMLPNHAPLVIAEQFGTLEASPPAASTSASAAPPARTAPPPPPCAAPDRLNEGADDFPQQLAELTRFLDDDFPDGHPYRRIHAVPGPIQAPPRRRPVPAPPAGLAARLLRLQRPAGRRPRPALRLRPPLLRAEHRSRRSTSTASPSAPRPVLDAPYAAHRRLRARRRRREGGPPPGLSRRAVDGPAAHRPPRAVPTPEEAEAYAFSPMEREFVDSWNANVVHGTAGRGPHRPRRPPEAHRRRRADAHGQRPQPATCACARTN